MTFLNENLQFGNAADFAVYLESVPKPSWAMGSTYHNTFSPTIDEWRGSVTMLAMQRFYESKGWDRGPHLYIAVGAPDPDHDGIWIMTSLDRVGIHAGLCNGDESKPKSGRWGIEVVGDFNTVQPSNLQLDLMTDALAMLHRRFNIGMNINTHRDCMPGRTCPGDAFYAMKDSIIRMIDVKIKSVWSIWSIWGNEYPLPIEQRNYGIPQTWYSNAIILGSAKSFPVYDVNNVVQLFERGMIIHRDGRSRMIMYSGFRVP